MIKFSASASYGNGGKQFIARIVGRHKTFTFQREFIGKKGGKRNEDCSADVDEPGLYETRDIDRKGKDDDTQYLVIETPAGLVKWSVSKDDAMKIAKELDNRPFDKVIAYCPAVPASPLRLAKVRLAQVEAAFEAEQGKDTAEEVESPYYGKPTPRSEVQFARAAEIARLKAEVERRTGDGQPDTPAADDCWDFLTEKAAARKAAAATVDAAVVECAAILAALPLKQQTQLIAHLKKTFTPAKPKPEATPAV